MIAVGRVFGVVAVAATALAISGCGGSGSSGAKKSAAPTVATSPAASPPPVQAAPQPPARSAPPRVSKAGYIRKANRICSVASGRLAPVRAKTVGAAKVSDPKIVFKRYATLTGHAASVFGATLGDLRGLNPPPADQAQIDRLNMLLAQLVGINHELSAAAGSQNTGRVSTLSLAANTAATRYGSAARAYGLRSCGAVAQLAVFRRGNR